MPLWLSRGLINRIFPNIIVSTCPTGAAGPATIAVSSTVVELEPGDPPTVQNVGTAEDAILEFGIPRGATGATGRANGLNVFGVSAALSISS